MGEMDSLKALKILDLKTFMTNISCKLSAITYVHPPDKQILCVVTIENDIVLHLSTIDETEDLKRICWFQKNSKIVQDICFDPAGTKLLVLCLDNSLHIVPALKIFQEDNDKYFMDHKIISFIIPFTGPHLCPCPQKCPNLEIDLVVENCSTTDFEENGDSMKTSTDLSSSISVCPQPTSTVWWQTIDLKNRAIIGYSDGSICFVELAPNCPFIASTAIDKGAVEKLTICRDNTMQNVSLLINSSQSEQYKLLLEKTCINFLYPGDLSPKNADNSVENWQIVVPVNQQSDAKDNENSTDKEADAKERSFDSTVSFSTNEKSLNKENVEKGTGILPTAKAKLASLKDLGTKKLNRLKMKLAETKSQKVNETDNNIEKFTIIDSPQMVPELLSSVNGPSFAAQVLRNTFFLSALRSNLNTLSIYSMDTSFLPLFLYKLPNSCREILIGSNVLYTIHLQEMTEENFSRSSDAKTEPKENKEINENPESESLASEIHPNIKYIDEICVLSSSMASMKTGQEEIFNERSVLRKFSFENETIINLHRKLKFPKTENALETQNQIDILNLKFQNIKTSSDYVFFYKREEENKEITLSKEDILKSDINKLNFDPCYIITNRNIYYIDFTDEPVKLFLDAAVAGKWNSCEEFCNTFDLNYTQCMEFAGDYLLETKKVTQALVTYNVAKVPIIKTALKLALHKETYALMHLCAMALKVVYLLKSKYFNRRLYFSILQSLPSMHVEEFNLLNHMKKSNENIINEGWKCSDYVYGVDEPITSLQMTASSQFHLSNLLLITLVERTVKDKNYVPLWNFIHNNSKFHYNMASIVLSQSGLYSAAVILAMTKGAFLDVFVGLVNAANQEFGFYSELNVCLYNLTEPIFVESITYLHRTAHDYFDIIESKMNKILPNVLERLEQQLNPFSGIYRSMICQPFTQNFIDCDFTGADCVDILSFCSHLVETYINVIVNMLKHNATYLGNILNAFDTFNVQYETNHVAVCIPFFTPLAVGCTNCAYVVDGVAYFWGNNGIPLVYDSANFTDLAEPPYTVKRLEILNRIQIEVYAVKCGRQHVLILTNNGLYSFGSNNLYQLGVGKNILQSLQPLHVKSLDLKYISLIEAGQYHNAVIAENKLYTWGWGVYGQLGHGSTENIDKPKRVIFFKRKNIINVSLGHAHSLVLCSGDGNFTELYVFGSNHFGQLGIGTSTVSKLLLPTKLEFSANIVLICTKFFTNLAVDSDNKLYTWGSSPQALRLANQMKRRTNSKQKLEESIKKEIDRRKQSGEDETTDCCDIKLEVPVLEKAREMILSKSPLKIRKNKRKDSEVRNKEESSSEQLGTLMEADTPQNSPLENQNMENQTEQLLGDEIPESEVSAEKEKFDTNFEANARASSSADVLNDSVNISDSAIEDADINVESAIVASENIATSEIEHLMPHIVDSSEVSGRILQISCGLFHCALISSTNTLYTWGKNIEHQLGTEDRERKPVAKPSPIEAVENPLFVHCGYDFTVVITTDYAVKAFGGNSYGQCGKDLSSENKSGRLFCLPTTKRLLRLDGNCSESPHEIPVPKPKIKFEKESIRFLKSIPKYQKKFLQRFVISKDTSFQNIAGNSNGIGNGFSEGFSSSFESSEISDVDPDSLTPYTENIISSEDTDTRRTSITTTYTNNYIHYCLTVLHGLYNPEKLFTLLSKEFLEFKVRILMLNFKFLEAFKMCLLDCNSAIKSIQIFEYFTKDTSIVPIKRQDMKFFIHSLLNHFIRNNYDLKICEQFFMSDLDYYLSELTSVLFFSSDNYKLDENLTKQLKKLFIADINEKSDYLFENSELIFDSISVKFKTVVCKKVLNCLVH
ncbi:uncharacterized protein LOC129610598 [Condylostylus longicornis]|uniref:uncharacterized protein LOC129610598 n=1 Tax=Condylostylus longicornis TaxID=2530218 RepID=UPI00244DD44E|nr:uncharacterized protein LOC129610598 [Condylostylus longicornis]